MLKIGNMYRQDGKYRKFLSKYERSQKTTFSDNSFLDGFKTFPSSENQSNYKCS